MERRDRAWEQLVQPHRNEVDVGDVSLHYVDLGDGQPVVLIHGIADSTYSWHKNTRALVEAGFRVIMVDQPGFGYSSIPDAGWVYSVESQGEAILRLLDHLEIERFDLVGHSLGGGVSLYLTWKHPGRVRRLVVISPASQRTSCPFGVTTDVVLALTGTRWLVGQALRSAFFDPEQVSDTMIDEYARLLDRPGRAGGGVLGGRASDPPRSGCPSLSVTTSRCAGRVRVMPPRWWSRW